MGKRIHILMLSARGDYGGGPEHVYQLTKGLLACSNYRISVAIPEEAPYWQRFGMLKGVTLLAIPHRRFRWAVVRQLQRFINQQHVDVVHTHGKGAGSYGFALSWLVRCQHVHTPHGIHIEQYGALKRWLYRCYENQHSRRLSALIYVSSGEQRLAKQKSIWQHARQSVVILNGIPDRGKLAQSSKCQVITVSRFDYQKNMQEALAIAQALPGVEFLWLGDGPERASLQLKAKQAGVDNIQFVGFVKDVSPYLLQAKLYLSTARWEGLPLSLLEAFSCGLPAVVSDVVGNQDVVEHGKTGFCYPLGNIEQAVEAIRRLLHYEDHYKEMSRAAYQCYLNRYTVNRMYQQTAELYKELMSASSVMGKSV